MNPHLFPLDTPIPLPQQGTWPSSVHVFDQKSADAVNAALAARRPLLIRGEPGTGKSQLARAVAHVLGRLFVSYVVNARSEAEDLLYHSDAVGRLGRAQALGASPVSKQEVDAQLDEVLFLQPGPLWWAFDSASAQAQNTRCVHPRFEPASSTTSGAVLLIDEIDKADADFPNGLLETLGNGAFPVPWLKQTVGLADPTNPPLVVVTTNEERELPGAFVRRCMVLHLVWPEEKQTFIQALAARGQAHFGDDTTAAVRLEAARQLWGDRERAQTQGVTPPGQAEYLDILRAIVEWDDARDEKTQLALLERIAPYALNKYG